MRIGIIMHVKCFSTVPDTRWASLRRSIPISLTPVSAPPFPPPSSISLIFFLLFHKMWFPDPGPTSLTDGLLQVCALKACHVATPTSTHLLFLRLCCHMSGASGNSESKLVLLSLGLSVHSFLNPAR